MVELSNGMWTISEPGRLQQVSKGHSCHPPSRPGMTFPRQALKTPLHCKNHLSTRIRNLVDLDVTGTPEAGTCKLLLLHLEGEGCSKVNWLYSIIYVIVSICKASRHPLHGALCTAPPLPPPPSPPQGSLLHFVVLKCLYLRLSVSCPMCMLTIFCILCICKSVLILM